MGLIKGWLVAVLAAVVFAIAPMYYGLFATLNGPANKEKWFTPERRLSPCLAESPHLAWIRGVKFVVCQFLPP